MSSIRQINFLSKEKYAYIFSGTLFLISLISLSFKGLELGIDFTGGSVYELHYNQSVDLDKMRNALETQGFEGANLQHFGSSQDILIRLKPVENINQQQLTDKVVGVANQSQSDAGQVRRVEFVGPQVGSELTNDGGIAVFFAFIGIMMYIWVRFEWRLSVSAVIALFHDSIIMLGIFSVFGWEFDLTVLSAILALIGYSINDKIVIYDRIRETVRSSRANEKIYDIINRAINDTLSRTILTAFTVFLSMLALAVLGGKVIHGFAIAMLIGVVKGTYSSIYIGSAIAIAMGLTREHLMPPKKDDTADLMP
jgi:preprotein translocase subunit SecF